MACKRHAEVQAVESERPPVCDAEVAFAYKGITTGKPLLRMNMHELILIVNIKKSYRERYWNLTSFVDEYIGDAARMLSIGFFDPSLLGFSLSTCDSGVETVVMAVLDIGKFEELDPAVRARTGLNSSLAYLLHQVRKRPDGKGNEIRSRFWFGKTFLDNIGLGGAASLQFGHDMAVHCFTEMTHLGSYLPALFNEFKNDIIVL